MIDYDAEQIAIRDSSDLGVSWLWEVSASPATLYWSHKNKTFGGQNYVYKIPRTGFAGVTLNRAHSEYGIQTPSRLVFSVLDPDNSLTSTDFEDQTVHLKCVVDNGTYERIMYQWRWTVARCEPGYRQLKFTCEDFTQKYFKGEYPTKRLIKDLSPEVTSAINDNACVPVPFGVAYVPLRSLYLDTQRYYILGESDGTYEIHKVRSPRGFPGVSTWASDSYSFTQSTDTLDGVDYSVFRPIIADSDEDGTEDACGLWLDGDHFADMPTKFSKSTTFIKTNPADVLEFVMEDMGVPSAEIDTGADSTFATCGSRYDTWGLDFEGAYFFKQEKEKVIAALCTSCASTLVPTDKVELRVLRATSLKTVGRSNVLKSSGMAIRSGPGTLRYSIIDKKGEDAGQLAYQVDDEPIDELIKFRVSATGATPENESSDVLELPFVHNSIHAATAAVIHYQRKFLAAAHVLYTAMPNMMGHQPEDPITMSHADYGGTYKVLIDSMTIKPDLSIGMKCIRFSQDLNDWEDLTETGVTPATDTTPTYAWQYVTAGPGSGSGTMGVLPGPLRVGAGSDYIWLSPTGPAQTFFEGGDEVVKIGKLATGVTGIRGKDPITGDVLFEVSSDTANAPYVSNYADHRAIELELAKMSFQTIGWAQFAMFDALDDESKRASPDPATHDARVFRSRLDNGEDTTANRTFGFNSKDYDDVTDVETGTPASASASTGGQVYILDNTKSWFLNEVKELTLVDSTAATFHVVQNTTDQVYCTGGTPATGGDYTLRDALPHYAAGYMSYSDANNGGYGGIILEASFDGGSNYQTFYDSVNAPNVDRLQGAVSIVATGRDWRVRVSLKNDALGRGALVYKFLVCADPTPWRW